MEIIYLPRISATPTIVPQAPSRDARGHASSGVLAGSEGKPPATLDWMRNPANKAPAAQTPAGVDWAGEIETQAARSAASQAPSFKDFSFPHAPEPASAHATEFAWDRVHTHRVESLPGGGILVHLDDNCVLVFIPLPIAVCGIGKKPANGDLFKDMKAPR